jgi:hypothetical protein
MAKMLMLNDTNMKIKPLNVRMLSIRPGIEVILLGQVSTFPWK